MATEKLLPNAKTGWTGPVTNIDEGVASADGLICSVTNTTSMRVDFFPSAVADGDTVTAVRPKVRARSTTVGGTDNINVDLYIGGVKKGTTQTTALTASFVDLSFNNAGWDVDWTAAEMDGIQLDIFINHTGEAQPIASEVDAIDLDITFTLGPLVIVPGFNVDHYGVF